MKDASVDTKYRRDSMMRNFFFRSISFYVVIACMLLAGCSNGDGVVDGVVEVTTTDRPWVMEEEFQQNPSLRATLDQIIILNLEPAPQGGDIFPSRNTIPYLVRDIDRDPLSFCIPADEQYIVALEIESSAGKTVMRTERGKGCDPVTLAAGRYRLHVFHDGRAIAPPGKRAFLHRPGAPRLLGGSVDTPTPPDFLAIRGPNNKFITLKSPTDEGSLLQSTASEVGWAEALYTDWMEPYKDAFSVYTFNWEWWWCGPAVNMWNGPASSQNWDWCSPPMMFTGVRQDCMDAPCGGWVVNDLGNYQFNFSSGVYGVGINLTGAIEMESDGITLTWIQNATGAKLTADYKGFFCTSSCDASVLPLAEGEVALFSKPNFIGPAVIFIKDVPDLSIYDGAATWGGALGDDTVASVRVGPGTLAVLYEDAQFGGDVLAFSCGYSQPGGNGSRRENLFGSDKPDRQRADHQNRCVQQLQSDGCRSQ